MTRTNAARIKAHRAFSRIKESSPTLLATRVNLYKKCLDGVSVFEALRPRVTPRSNVASYTSLTGQRTAPLFAAATLDNVLTVLIDETVDHKWQWDVVTDIPGLTFGSPIGQSCASREEAEKCAICGLEMLGAEQTPSEDFRNTDVSDAGLQIRVNGDTYIVPEWPDDFLSYAVSMGKVHYSTTGDALLAIVADNVLRDTYPPGRKSEFKAIALGLLANCGWTHLTREVLDEFCAANGINLSEATAGTEEGAVGYRAVQ
jgi:hypothetical protein